VKQLEIHVTSLDFSTLRIIDKTGNLHEYDLQEILKITEANLEGQMLEQASTYIYWASLLEELKYYQELAEKTLEKVIADLDPEARKHLTNEGTKPTKDTVDAYIKRQDEYDTAKTDLLNYNRIVGRVARVVKAFEQRKDMLQSYGKQVSDQKSYGHGAGSRFMDTSQVTPFGQGG
jgi:transcriptional regulator of heat shock response